MEQLIIEELIEGYETVTIRTTNLEAYNECPFRYKYEPKKKDTYSQFVFGNLVHWVCQNYLMARIANPNNDIEIVNQNIVIAEKILYPLSQQHPDWFMVKAATEKTPEHWVTLDRLRTYIRILDAHYANDKFIVAEFPMTLEIHMWEFKIVITGKLDLLTIDSCVMDLKTAAREWKEESIKNKLQKIIYLYMMYTLVKKEDIRFDYAILRTDLKLEKNVKLQIVKTKLDVAAFEYILWEIALSFAYSYKHNIRSAKQCDACRYCELWPKHTKKCPLFDKPTPWQTEESLY